MIDEHDLHRLLHSTAYDLTPPPDALQQVQLAGRRLRRRRRARRLVPVALLAVAALLVGVPRALPGTPQDSLVAARLGPLPAVPQPDVREQFSAMRGDAVLQSDASEELLRRCMAAKGFVYETVTIAPRGGYLPAEYSDDVPQAQRDGYGLPEALAAERRMGSGTAPHVQALSQEQERRWYDAFSGPGDSPQVTVPTTWNGGEVGMSSAGCLAEASAELFGSVRARLQTDFAVNGRSAALLAAEESKDKRALDVVWRRCMQERGQPFDDPGRARASARQAYQELPASVARAQELRTATADATCEAETGYARDRRRLEDRYLTALLQRHPADADRAAQANRHADAQARLVLGDR